MKIQASDMDRFNKYYTKTDTCWLWNGCCLDSGRGLFRFNGKVTVAARAAWELFRGPIPTGLFVLHKCDVPACVNPDHLFVGTQKDNMRDCVKKGRLSHQRPFGASHGGAKLSNKDVIKIRDKRKGGMTLTAIADQYKLRHQTIHNIVTGKTWKHL